MDEFKTYHSICELADILEKYPDTKELCERAQRLLEQLSSRQYRVAVLGEFKRGKSSLVNTLLGTEILPTDILPTTAVVNRIVYDTSEKIEIVYKDGSVFETTTNKLSEYATKLDAEKEKTALSIREIIVHYPSVFGQNNIEIIDTPGLNDNESMTETTLSVLGNTDTAIVVLSAAMPLSMTEQKLICDLIEQKNIYHLTFAATFIDRVSDETEEQDRAINTIAERLRENTLDMFKEKHSGNDKLIAKAEKILSEPCIFGVSSKLATEGFIKNSKKLLDMSRFPHFKFNLMSILVADRQLDLESGVHDLFEDAKRYFAERISRTIRTNLDKHCAAENTLTEKIAIDAFDITAEFMRMDAELERFGFSFDNALQCTCMDRRLAEKVYIDALSIITKNDYSEGYVKSVVSNAALRCTERLRSEMSLFIGILFNEMKRIEDNIFKRYGHIDAPTVFKGNAAFNLLMNEDGNCSDIETAMAVQGYPSFEAETSLFDNSFPADGNVMPAIRESIANAFEIHHHNICLFIASWRKKLMDIEQYKRTNLMKELEAITYKKKCIFDGTAKFNDTATDHVKFISKLA